MVKSSELDESYSRCNSKVYSLKAIEAKDNLILWEEKLEKNPGKRLKPLQILGFSKNNTAGPGHHSKIRINEVRVFDFYCIIDMQIGYRENR